MRTFLIFIFILNSINVNSQTYVSGGIFTDTTWTLANSPYIVTGDVVVFAGYTLTVEPGVVVKFNNGYRLEIRHSFLIAEGDSLNKIIFTSNDPAPYAGSWFGLEANASEKISLNHCKFEYANTGFTGEATDSIRIRNCIFSNNIIGTDARCNSFFDVDSCEFSNNSTGQISNVALAGYIRNSQYKYNTTGLYSDNGGSIRNCLFTNNSGIALLKHMACNDTISDNTIEYNGTGIAHDFSGCGGEIWIINNEIRHNNVGINLANIGGFQQFYVYNNCICQNTSYNFENLSQFNLNLSGNNWCTTNTTYISNHIYDAMDNVNYGLITYHPLDTTLCPMILNIGIEDVYQTAVNINIYPNPANDIIRVNTDLQGEYQMEIYDGKGSRVYSQVFNNSYGLNVSTWKEGVYMLKLVKYNSYYARRLTIIHN